MKRNSVVFVIVALLAGMSQASITASWLAPPDGSSYLVGTVVNPNGNANASGVVGGSGLDLGLVIDTSGSMGSWYSGKTTMQWAKDASNSLVDALPAASSSVSVTSFDSSGNLEIGLTPVSTGAASIHAAINGLSDSGLTYIGSGISVGGNSIVTGGTTGRSQMMVVLSDGYPSDGAAGQTQAAYFYNNHGIITHTVGVPGHSASTMQNIATAGHGIYTSVSDLTSLESLFNGTGGNLVGLDHIDVTLPDGTLLSNYSTDGLGNFTLPNWAIGLGANTFTVNAYDSVGNMATADLTLYGTVVPVPAAMLLGLLGLGTAGMRLRRKSA